MDPDVFYSFVRGHLPQGPASFMELGGAPGAISANLVVDTELAPYAVDFSDNPRAYLPGMAAIGKEGTLFETDVFAFESPQPFDVVASFGLVEHFAGDELDRQLRIHDDLTRPGGWVVIEMPNVRGIQRVWHMLADRPNLRLHNLDAMRLQTFNPFAAWGYETRFKGYFGTFRVWQETRFLRTARAKRLVTFGSRAVNKAAREARRIGIHLEGPRWSPYLVYIGRKPEGGAMRSPVGR